MRLRHEVLPLLEDVLGGVAEGLARTASLLGADDDELDRLARAVPVGSDGALEVSRLEPLPAAVLTRVLRRWLLARGITSPTYAHLTAVAALVTDWHGQGGVAVGGTGPADAGGVGPSARLVARRRRGKVVLENDRESGAGT